MLSDALLQGKRMMTTLLTVHQGENKTYKEKRPENE